MKKIIVSLLTLFLFYFTYSAYAEIKDEQAVMVEFEQVMERHHGKVIYLDFWASWCVPCRKSFPWMNAMQSQYKSQGFVVLSINLDANRALATKFLQETPATFEVIYDEKGLLAKKFQLKGMPSSYLFNRDGELISSHSGFNQKKKHLFEQEIKQALQ
jgi:thiol-disulfide isomerase/thioredoxin